MSVKSYYKAIRELKIQGAESIALAAIEAIESEAKKISAKDNPKQAIKHLTECKRLLCSARPTEPMLRNVLTYILNRLEGDSAAEIRKEVIYRINSVRKSSKESKSKIIAIGARLIKKKSNIFTTCHSSTVVDILRAAKRKGVKFTVYNTETRPRYQGRKTAMELAEAGIQVNYFIDAASQVAIKESDMVLLGCDAICADGSALNKIGSGMYSVIAKQNKKPVYICTDSLKFDPATRHNKEIIEHRDPGEVWKIGKKNINIFNPAFELIEPENITAIVSELGILNPRDFVRAVRKNFIFRTINRAH